MLNPCKPCVCSVAPCEQCVFGYASDEERHKRILKLLLEFKANKKTIGWKCAETFMRYHPDWEKEIKKEEDEAVAYRKDNPCEQCLHFEVCGNKDKFLSIVKEVDNGSLAEYKDIPWINFTIRCMHFKYK